jgi:hypothetical protein
LNKCKSEKKIIFISFRERKIKIISTAFNLNNNIKQFNKDNQALVDKSTCIRKINLSVEFESRLSKLILNHFKQLDVKRTINLKTIIINTMEFEAFGFRGSCWGFLGLVCVLFMGFYYIMGVTNGGFF